MVANESVITRRIAATERLRGGPILVPFEIVNQGNADVQITSVESSCGCTVASVDPTLVKPGGRAVLRAEATPLATGRRQVEIGVHSDSPGTPRLQLTLVMIAERQPPFFLHSTPNLDFRFIRGDAPSVGEFQLFLIQPSVATHKPSKLEVSSDLPFLEIRETESSESPYLDADAAIMKSIRYRVSISAIPDVPRFQGEIRIADPWEAGRTRVVKVEGEVLPPLRTVPARLRLERSSAGIFDVAECLVLRGTLVGDFRIAKDECNVCPLTVSKRPTPGGETTATLPLAIGIESRAQPGEHHFTLESVRDPSITLKVPVLIAD